MKKIDIANKLIDLRKKNKLTISDLSDKLNIKESIILDWENNELVPSYYMLKKLCNIYNVDINYFVDSNTLFNNLLKVKTKNILLILISLFLSCIIILSINIIMVSPKDSTSINTFIFEGESDNFKFRDGIFIFTEDKNDNYIGIFWGCDNKKEKKTTR